MAMRFNVPPAWPQPPAGWIPPKDWRPDPSWPPAPQGWVFWIEDSSAAAALPADSTPSPLSGAKGPLGGLFGPGKRALEEENAQLRDSLQRVGGMDLAQVRQETERARRELVEVHTQLVQARGALAQVRSGLVEMSEIAQLQEAGIYQYAHPLANAVGYKDLLARVKSDTKTMVTAGRAVEASTTWQVNGSAAAGRKMVTDFCKLLLRAYNAEADNCVRTVKPHSRSTAKDRLTKAAETIARLGKTMDIRISTAYHQVRLYEIELTADFLAKVEEEKERTREEREHLREEAAAQRDFEREKAKLRKEQEHYLTALDKLRANAGTPEAIAEIQAKLSEIGVEMGKVISREANIRAGYVYVISNIGAFGERMVKIGLTRRLEPMDRVRELGDASVPFKFDVHALIFSENAVSLETQLHQRLADRKVNRVNNAREFFYATPTEVKELLADVAGQHLLEYTEEPEAAEWRASSHALIGVE